MNNQNSLSLEIADIREKAIDLTKEFDSKNRLGRINYSRRLDNFLKKRIGNSVRKVFIGQVLLSTSILKMSNRTLLS